MGNRALVTGALGHTGSFLVNLLADEDWNVVATDLKSAKRKQLMKKETVFSSDFKYMDIERDNVQFIAADLTDKESLKKLFTDKIKDYDVIFHPASLYDYFAPLDLLRRINVDGLRNFLDVILETYGEKIPRFLHWSTCGVYGEPEYKHNSEGFPIVADETADYNPPNNYSISKMEQELLIKEFAKKHKFPYTIIRPAPIYGPYQTYGAFHIFYMLHKMGHMVIPMIFPKKHQLIMPCIHVEDLVRAAYFLWDKEEAIHEVYNVVGDNTMQSEWMEYVCQELGMQYTHIPVWWPLYKLAAKIAFKWAAGEEKKARKYGIRPKFDLPMAGYILHQYFFSNQKIKDMGFKFKFGDPFKGARQTIRWYIDAGWFEEEEWHLVGDEWLPDSQKNKKEGNQ
ncbi:MAG: NAD-dependent epimerase/dehydratase family protein [Candidatus Lokiarchaeota archaeon]|nr:NAD-dependent epimerase/dehydratase family protein [Candidatus Lokiarchaeota archaeon]